GGVFFDSSYNMDNEEYLQPILTSQEEHFKKLDTVSIVSFPLIFSVFLEITGIIFICMWPEEKNKCDTYFTYLYLHCAYWLIIMFTDHLVKTKHHKLRIYGYLEFYQSTYQQIRTPLFIASLWMTCYLLLAVILHHVHKVNYEEYCRASEWFTPLNYIVLLTTIELIIIIPVYINYIKKINIFYFAEKVLRFNRLRPPPDVSREDWLFSFTQDTYAGSHEVGYRHGKSNLEELLEKQADLIRYLRDHNGKLSHKIMLLAAQRTLPQT
ncbi:hypothetical protein WN51_08510, partial [Melipona quadrifasciata]